MLLSNFEGNKRFRNLFVLKWLAFLIQEFMLHIERIENVLSNGNKLFCSLVYHGKQMENFDVERKVLNILRKPYCPDGQLHKWMHEKVKFLLVLNNG